MSSNVVFLSAGTLELELSPSTGGAISNFRHSSEGERVPILRESHSPLENVLDAASFPLVPFVNRIRGGRFTFRGREVRLERNLASDPSPLHGQGWLNPWKTERADATSAVLTYSHAPADWPWAYDARQEFELDDRGLTLRLACRNRTSEPMPCGLGQHPYFACTPHTRLHTEVTHVWTIDENVLPVEKVPATGRFDLTDRSVCCQDLDHGFAGWGGLASMRHPDWPFDVEMSSPTARFFQLYSPTSGRFFVAEPVTHANAALNAPEEQWPELGIEVLEPDEEMILEMRLEIRFH